MMASLILLCGQRLREASWKTTACCKRRSAYAESKPAGQHARKRKKGCVRIALFRQRPSSFSTSCMLSVSRQCSQFNLPSNVRASFPPDRVDQAPATQQHNVAARMKTEMKSQVVERPGRCPRAAACGRKTRPGPPTSRRQSGRPPCRPPAPAAGSVIIAQVWRHSHMRLRSRRHAAWLFGGRAGGCLAQRCYCACVCLVFAAAVRYFGRLPH